MGISHTDPDSKYLGELCSRGHNFEGSGKSWRYKGGNRCAACASEVSKIYRKTSVAKIVKNDWARKWRKNNREKCRRSVTLWREKNTEKNKISSRAHDKKRRPKRRLKIQYILRKRLGTALKRAGIKKTSTSRKYGINYKEIERRLGPCPGERKDFHIDHIVPVSAFDFNDPVQISLAFHPANHQWLPVSENKKKHAALPESVPDEISHLLKIALHNKALRGSNDDKPAAHR